MTPKGYFGIHYEETHWAVICKRKSCAKTFAFAIIRPKDGKFYPRIVALECPECHDKRRYHAHEPFRMSTMMNGTPVPMTSPLFEE